LQPLFADALAVARETMRRVRHNVEALIPRLIAAGYQFGYGWVQPYVRERLIRPYHVAYPGRFGELVEPSIPEHFAFGYRFIYEEMQELARSQPPLFTPANDREERIAHIERNLAAARPHDTRLHDLLRTELAELRAKPTAQDLVAELEAMLGTLPLSVRAWYELVGGVNLVGDHPSWRELLPEVPGVYPTDEYDYLNPMSLLDPLVIHPLDEARLGRLRSEVAANQPSEQARHHLNLAPDGRWKYLDNGGGRGAITIVLPTPAMDVPTCAQGQTFVGYVRECFRWGGFPGWSKLEKRPEKDLTFLREGMLAI
jgi:hypothetical protein